MHIRRAIAATAILGILALGAFVSVAAACGDGKATQTGAMGAGCPMHKADGGGGCAKGSGSCSFMGAGACGAMSGGAQQCSMPFSQCDKMMRTYYQTHGWLGVEMACANPDNMQPTVTKIFPGSPAEQAGLKVGDILTAVNGIPYGPDSKEALQKLAADGMKVGDAVAYKVTRASEKTDAEVKATLAKIPEPVLAQLIADHKATAHREDKAEAVSPSSKKS